MLNVRRQERAQERAGDADAEGTLRTCIVTRRELAPEAMIRFVPAPDGSVVPDLARRLPGRGAWVTATREAVTTAVKTRAFAKSFKRPATAADDLPDLVERLLARRLLDAISLATKAGELLTGFGKVDGVIGSGEAIALLHGSDAAADGRHKLDRKYTAISDSLEQPVVIVDTLKIDELSLAIGRGNVVHGALREGGAARRVVAEAERMLRYRSGTGVS